MPSGISEESGNDENKSIVNALKKETAGEKETLVDDLNAEIDGDEEDESHFEHLKEENAEKVPKRSRNVGGGASGDSAAAKNDLSLDKEGDEVRTEELENTNQASKEPQYDYTVMDELMDFFDQDKIEAISCGYFNKVI